MDLSFEDFSRFFDEKKKAGVQYTCGFCGSAHFVPAFDANNRDPAELAVAINPRPGLVAPGHHAFFGIVCTNCGKTDLIHVNAVAAWKQAKQLQGGGT